MAPTFTVTVRIFVPLLQTCFRRTINLTILEMVQGLYRVPTQKLCAVSLMSWKCLIPSSCAELLGIACMLSPTDASPKHASPFLCVFCDHLVMVRKLMCVSNSFTACALLVVSQFLVVAGSDYQHRTNYFSGKIPGKLKWKPYPYDLCSMVLTCMNRQSLSQHQNHRGTANIISSSITFFSYSSQEHGTVACYDVKNELMVQNRKGRLFWAKSDSLLAAGFNSKQLCI